MYLFVVICNFYVVFWLFIRLLIMVGLRGWFELCVGEIGGWLWFILLVSMVLSIG